jgi:hypothetical protein
VNANRAHAGGAIATIKPQDGSTLPVGELMERIIAAGDVSQLSAGDRAHYLVRVAESAGLNPLSQPFDLIPGQGGKLKLYPNKSATDQLRKLYRLRTVTRSARELNGTYVVEVEVTDGWRAESNIGAVTIEGLRGEALANALMKCHTKAKRRATLDWCGLGILDETEIEGLNAAMQERAAAGWVIEPDAASALGDGIADAETQEVVNHDTGELAPELAVAQLTADQLNEEIKRLRGRLGWSQGDVLTEAGSEKLNLQTMSGLRDMVLRLQYLVDRAEGDDAAETNNAPWDADEGRLIDAESRVVGEPGNDRHSA